MERTHVPRRPCSWKRDILNDISEVKFFEINHPYKLPKMHQFFMHKAIKQIVALLSVGLPSPYGALDRLAPPGMWVTGIILAHTAHLTSPSQYTAMQVGARLIWWGMPTKFVPRLSSGADGEDGGEKPTLWCFQEQRQTFVNRALYTNDFKERGFGLRWWWRRRRRRKRRWRGNRSCSDATDSCLTAPIH